MNEKPILFSGPMIRAILAGTKVQTRRVIKSVAGIGKVTEFQPSDTPGYDWIMRDSQMRWNDLRHKDILSRCPYPVGTRLWVKETWREASSAHFLDRGTGRAVHYRADPDEPPATGCWKSPRFMPRWASRLTLEVLEVRVQRVQEISDRDCEAEGVRPSVDGNAKDWLHDETGWRRTFRQLWDSINAKRSGCSWAANPFCWVLTFRRV